MGGTAKKKFFMMKGGNVKLLPKTSGNSINYCMPSNEKDMAVSFIYIRYGRRVTVIV